MLPTQGNFICIFLAQKRSKKMLPSFQNDIFLFISEVILYINTRTTVIVYAFQRLKEHQEHVSKFIRNKIKTQKMSLDGNVNPLKTHLFRILLLFNIC